MAKWKFSKYNSKKKMGFRDEPEETESGMYLSLLADEPGEAEAAMVLNSLVDDPEELARETFNYLNIRGERTELE